LNFDLIDCTVKFIAEGKIEKTGESVHRQIDPRGRHYRGRDVAVH